MVRPFNVQQYSPMVPRWPCSLKNASRTSLSPRLAWRRDPKRKNIQQKSTETANPAKSETRNRWGRTIASTKRLSPAHPWPHPLLDSRPKCQFPQFKSKYHKLTKRRDKHINPQDGKKRFVITQSVCACAQNSCTCMHIDREYWNDITASWRS